MNNMSTEDSSFSNTTEKYSWKQRSPESPSKGTIDYKTKKVKKKLLTPKVVKLQKNDGFLFNNVFSYSTVRLAKIHNKKIAILFRVLQLSIIGYIIGWSIIYKKGYQQVDNISSTVSTKVKGTGYTINFKNETIFNKYVDGQLLVRKQGQVRIFDTADYVIPAAEYNSIFIMTNYIETKQTQDICEEDIRNKATRCDSDYDCMTKETSNSWSGIPTGNCIRSLKNAKYRVCEVAAWCPVEDDSRANQNIINNVEQYTIFIKNDVKFEQFNQRHRNLLTNITNKYIKTCNFEPTRDPFCPVFTIKEILLHAEKDPKERERMLKTGGLIRIMISWNCNYDLFSRDCLPKYSFDRFDVPYKDNSSASGYNFRFSDKFERNGIMYRQLTKAYGLRFVVTVSGKAGKFNLLPLLLTLGSGLGLLSLATIIIDVILLNLTSKKVFYRQLKEFNYKNQNSESLENNNYSKY